MNPAQPEGSVFVQAARSEQIHPARLISAPPAINSCSALDDERSPSQKRGTERFRASLRETICFPAYSLSDTDFRTLLIQPQDPVRSTPVILVQFWCSFGAVLVQFETSNHSQPDIRTVLNNSSY
jgi:hypothetical protein